MHFRLREALTIIFLLFASEAAFAREHLPLNKWDAGLFLGSGFIKGELKNPRPEIQGGISIGYNLSRMLSIDCQANSGAYHSQGDAYTSEGFNGSSQRVNEHVYMADVNLYSRTKSIQCNLGFNFSPVFDAPDKFIITLKAGLGLLWFHNTSNFVDQRKQFDGAVLVMNPDFGKRVTSDYRDYATILPTSVNFRLSLPQRYYLALQCQYSLVLNDYLDTVVDDSPDNMTFDKIVGGFVKIGYAF